MPSFDVVSRTDLMEVDNAISGAKREIRQRYDLAGSKCDVDRKDNACLLYTSPSPRDRTRSRMPSSA